MCSHKKTKLYQLHLPQKHFQRNKKNHRVSCLRFHRSIRLVCLSLGGPVGYTIAISDLSYCLDQDL